MKKSSAEDKPTGRLEDIFRQKFDKAEATPPADLWSRLEHDLDVEDKNTYRQGMLRYRNIAAVALLLLLAAVTLLTRNLLFNSEPAGNLAVISNSNNISKTTLPETRERTEYAQNNPTKSGEIQSHETGKSVDQKAESVSSADEVSEENRFENSVSEKGQSGLKPGGATYAYQPTVKSEVEKNSQNRPIFKPGSKPSIVNPAIALQTKSPIISAGSARTGKTEMPVSDKPTLASAAKKSTTSDQADIAKTEDPETANNSLALQTIAIEEATKGNSSDNLGINTTKNSATDPENASAIAADQHEKPGTQVPELAMVKPEITEPDTSKPYLQQLATATEEIKKDSEKDELKSKVSKWLLTASLTPQTFTQNVMLRNNPESSGFLASKNSMDQLTVPGTFEAALADYETNTHSAFSYQVNVGAGYQIKPKWLLQSGIGFAQNKAVTDASYIITPVASMGSGLVPEIGSPVVQAVLFSGADSSNAIARSVSKYKVNYRYRYLQVPLQVTYQGIRQKWLYQVSAGLALNWLLSHKFSEDSENNQAEIAELRMESSDQEEVFNTFLPQAISSVKIGYKLNQHWQILAGPSVAFGLRSIVKENKASYRPNSLGSATFHNEQIEQKNPVNLGFTFGLSYQLPAKK